MKCIFSLLLALLAVFTVATLWEDINGLSPTPLPGTQPSAVADSSTITSDGAEPLAESLGIDPELKEWFKMLNQATRLNETWRSEHCCDVFSAGDSLSNTTTADVLSLEQRPRPNLDGYYRVDVRIGKGSTHTGTLRKGRMFKRIYAALKDCGNAQHDPSIPGFCSEDCLECADHCRMPSIVYNKDKLEYASDSFLKLKVKYSYFNIKNHPSIQDLSFRIITRIFELMTKQGDNCRFYNFPNSRPTYMCSVANKVELAFPINGGLIQGVLNVELTWSKKTDQSTFKCEGNTEGNVDAMMWTDYRGPLANAMGWPSKQVLPLVFCADDDRFQQVLYTSEPWHENINWPQESPAQLPPALPQKTAPAPPLQNKALSIIFSHDKSDLLNIEGNWWLFFASEYAVSSACREDKEAVKKVRATSGTVENPPWPGGTYTLKLFGIECDYKNGGTNTGALWCEWFALSQMPSQGKFWHIPCKEERTRWDKKAEVCKHGMVQSIYHHRVVTCD